MHGQSYGQILVKPLRIEKTQEWTNERPNKARQCWETEGINFIDPDDQDYKETLKNARRWDETHIESGYPAGAVTTQRTKQASHRITTTETPSEYKILPATTPLTRFIQAL